MIRSSPASFDIYLYPAAESVLAGHINLEEATTQLMSVVAFGKPSDGEIYDIDLLIQDLINTQREPMLAYVLAELNYAVCQRVGGPSQGVNCANTVGDAIANMRDPRLTLRRIEVYEDALEIVEVTGDDWRVGILCNNLGNAYSELPAGNHQSNLQKAAHYYQQALEIIEPNANPYHWAIIQSNLAAVYKEFPGSDKNILLAIDCWNQALEFIDAENHPFDWANIHRNLGIAYKDLTSGNPIENLAMAKSHLLSALDIYKPEHQPANWAEAQNSLGNVYFNMTSGNRSENLRAAVACFEAALEIRDFETFPTQFAATCVNLGNVWLSRPEGDRVVNLRRAIEYYQRALSVYTAGDFPRMNAQTHANLAAAYLYLPAGDRAQNLERAQKSLDIAKSVFTRSADPMNYAWIRSIEGAVFQDMARNDPKKATLAIASYQDALAFYSAEMFPQEYADGMSALGTLYRNFGDGELQANYRQAEQYYEAALAIYDPEVYPGEFARTQTDLGNCYLLWRTANRRETLLRAIEHYRKALNFHTREAFPRDYVRLMDGLGVAYSLLADQEKEYHTAALNYFREALHTAEAVGLRNEIARIAGNAGNLSWTIKDWSAAFQFLSQAIDAMEIGWSEHYSSAGKTGLLGEYDSLYGRMVQTCYQLESITDSFNYLEYGRSRLLLVLLGDTLLQTDPMPTDSHGRIGQLRTLANDLGALTAVMDQVLTPDQILHIIERRESLHQQKTLVLEELAKDQPELSALLQGRPLDYETTKEMLVI